MKTLLLFVLICFLAGVAQAKPKAKAKAKAKPAAKAAAKSTGPSESSSKEIDFDGEVIEGMNRQPLDSLTSLSEGQQEEDRSKGHVYRRKNAVANENKEATREILETY